MTASGTTVSRPAARRTSAAAGTSRTTLVSRDAGQAREAGRREGEPAAHQHHVRGPEQARPRAFGGANVVAGPMPRTTAPAATDLASRSPAAASVGAARHLYLVGTAEPQHLTGQAGAPAVGIVHGRHTDQVDVRPRDQIGQGTEVVGVVAEIRVDVNPYGHPRSGLRV